MTPDGAVTPEDALPEVTGDTIARDDATSSPISRAASRVTAGFLAFSILLAAYTGFRMPNLWSVTLLSVSLTDGFHRRFLVGTLLRPFAETRNHTYYFYAAVAFAILVALLVVISVAALRSRLLSQRFLVIAWLLLPTGGFLFNEVGYLDQLVYLMLFGAIWALRHSYGRSYWVAAPVLMTLAVVSHEVALLTVIPVFAFVALRTLDVRRALVSLAPPVLVGLVVLVIPASTSGARDNFTDVVAGANWIPRSDALAVFERSQSQSWELYKVDEVFYFLIPLAIIAVLGFLLMFRADRGFAPEASFPAWWHGATWPYPFLAVGAITAPVLLAVAGWDQWRWGFLLVSNFFIVVWLWLGDRNRELDALQFLTLGAVLLVSIHVSLFYFEFLQPRDISIDKFRELREQIDDGSLFDVPSR